jgi:membrane-bound lytic murein transglycosylase D
MKILPNLLTHCLIVFVFLSLSACSSHNKKSALQPSSPLVVSTDPEDEEISSAEPEETAQEELEALNEPGAWEYGANQTYSLKKLGIDPSKYDFPITVNKQVLYYLGLFQGKQRKSFSYWLARSSMYRPYIEAELKKAGLPLDLVYLAMIESGFNPSAYSPAKACGLWQFIEGTGSRYGLRIDSWVDERREPEKATKAATRYLSQLYAQFDDWYLAVAAYNAGEGKIDTAMKTFNATDFWEVASSEGIFMETKRYVPKLIAAIIIARNPEKYGFSDIPYKKPQEYETISIPGGVNLEAVATTANSSVKELRALNNELRKNQTPPKQKDYVLRIPVGTKDLVASNLGKLRPVTTIDFATHTVKKGETLAAICSMYNINKTTLLKANNLKTAQLSQGLRLKIPSTATKFVFPKDGQSPEERLAKAGNKGKQQQVVRHTLKPGETLETIAKQYQVPARNILQWNKISSLSKVKKGQQLALHLDRPTPEIAAVKPQISQAVVKIAAEIKQTAQVPTLDATKKRSATKSQPETVTAKESVAAAKKELPPTWYVVKNGDTLTTIARKFQASPQNIRAWNKLSNNTLQTGNKLIIKKG